MKRRKQNHKISFQFFAAPPCTPPRRFKRKGKEIFGFGSRLEGARGADCQHCHKIRAYDLVQSHHALRACEVNQNPVDFVHTMFELRPENTCTNIIAGRFPVRLIICAEGFSPYGSSAGFPFFRSKAPQKYGRTFSNPSRKPSSRLPPLRPTKNRIPKDADFCTGGE